MSSNYFEKKCLTKHWHVVKHETYFFRHCRSESEFTQKPLNSRRHRVLQNIKNIENLLNLLLLKISLSKILGSKNSSNSDSLATH